MADINAQLDAFLRDTNEGELYSLLSGISFEDYELNNDDEKLNSAIRFAETSVEKTPGNDPDHGRRLYKLGVMKLRRHDRTRDIGDFQRAIQTLKDAVTATPENNQDRQSLLNTLSNELLIKFDETGDFSHLEVIINLVPKIHLDRAAWLNSFSNQLKQRYEQTGKLKDLEAAICIAEYAVNSDPRDSDRAACFNTLSVSLSRRYEATGNHDDLTEAIRVARIAVNSAPESSPDRAACLNTLAIWLGLQYHYTGSIEHLQEAICLAKSAVEIAQNDLSLVPCLVTLGSNLERRSEITGDMDDLKEAIRQSKLALSLARGKENNYVVLLNNLGGQLERMYLRTGNTSLLDESIRHTRLACDSAPEKHVDRAMWLDNLATRLGRQFQRTGETELLNDAIEASRLSLAGTIDSSMYRAERLSNLGNKLMYRHIRTPNAQDLNESIRLTKLALTMTPETHPSSTSILNNLGNHLQKQYQFTTDIAHLDEAIQTLTRSIELTPSGHANWAPRQHNLAVKLGLRYNRTRDSSDMDKSVRILKLAMAQMMDDHPDRPVCMETLGHGYETQFHISKDRTYLDRALECFLRASQSLQAVPLLRIKAVRQAIGILHQQNEWDQANKLVREALPLLPLLCGRYLSRDDQQHAMIQASGLAADACSLALKTGDVDGALQQLEFGRGLILGYMIDSRSDLSELKRDQPTLAEEYETLRFKASRQINTEGSTGREVVLKERREAAQKIRGLLGQIRAVPGYERFLLEPAIDELKHLATEGPIVVVNVTDISADAILLTHSRLKALPLPELSSATALLHLQRHFRQYASCRRGDYERDIAGDTEEGGIVPSLPDQLSWLWSNCVKHVLEELKSMGIFTSPDVPRVWWVGSGLASSFPFHAAGKQSDNLAEDAMSRVVSSYSPTIKLLSYSGFRASKEAGASRKDSSILIVTMPETPGQRRLEGVQCEKDVIVKACGGIYSCKVLELPTADQVLETVPESNIVHFACHGSSDLSNPSDSHLLLQRRDGGKLVIDRLSVSRLSTIAAKGRAQIVFLSACSTAEVKAGKLKDEGLHLASAFQVVGFAHVIGSLWSADDDVCVRVAEIFYSYLTRSGTAEFSNKCVAMALRSAVMQIRADFPQNPSVWVPFVHFGA
jgi:tetratricopeptide (TPR) repeat protein